MAGNAGSEPRELGSRGACTLSAILAPENLNSSNVEKGRRGRGKELGRRHRYLENGGGDRGAGAAGRVLVAAALESPPSRPTSGAGSGAGGGGTSRRENRSFSFKIEVLARAYRRFSTQRTSFYYCISRS